MAVAVVTWRSEHLTYRSIWRAADTLQAMAQEPTSDRFSTRMAAVLLAYTAYEGFLNHMIERLYPAVWEQERTFFRIPPYEGTLGKTRFLAASASMLLERSDRPYRTVAELHAWRNDLVHPRTVRGKGKTTPDGYARRPAAAHPVAFRKLARTGFVSDCFEDLSVLADRLLRASLLKQNDEIREIMALGQHAFWGPATSSGASLTR